MSSQSLRCLDFSVGTQKCAIALESVKEVIGAKQSITPIPNSQPYNLGIINLRGNIVSIIDLRKKMGSKPLNNSEEAIIILNFESQRVGLMVDSVNQVFKFDSSKISPVPDIDDENNKFVESIYKQGNDLIIMIDLFQVLSIAKPVKTDLKVA